MKVVFFMSKDNYVSSKGMLYADELVSRQSITVRESSSIGKDKEGYYVLIDGDEEAIKRAKKLLKEVAEELKGKDAEEISGAIEGQESSAAEGFGAIFG